MKRWAMHSVRWFGIVWALSGASFASAQEPAAAPQPAPASGVQEAAQPASPSPSAPATPPAGVGPEAAAPSGSAVTQVPAPQAPVTGDPSSPPAAPVPANAIAPDGTLQPVYRGALPPPRLYPIRERPKRAFGDAGAPYAIGAGVSFGWPSDAGYALAGVGKRHARVELFAAYDVWQPVKKLVLSAGASFRSLTGSDGSVASIEERAIQADLLARYTLRPWLFPHLRGSFGAVGTTLEMEDPASYRVGANQHLIYEDSDWAPIATLGAGFTLRTRARSFETYGGHLSSLSFGVLVEGGASIAPAATLQLRPDSSPAGDVDVRTGRPGSLDRTAPYLRIAGVVRF